VGQGVGRYIEWLEVNSGFLANPLWDSQPK
jgi:hypothetical protein